MVKDAQMSVYQKNKIPMTPAEAQSLLAHFQVSSMDIGKFSNTVVTHMNLVEDRPYGLDTNMDFNEGIIDISKNFPRWPQVNCQDDACFQANQVHIESVPSDAKALEAANAFIEKYRISLAAYGAPYVDNEWRTEYDRTQDKSQAYVPETISVVYPLRVDGMSVYEEFGQKKGITVGIDVKTGLVSQVNGIEKLDFSESKYAVETDPKKILAQVEAGGRMSRPYPVDAIPPGIKTVTVEVRL